MNILFGFVGVFALIACAYLLSESRSANQLENGNPCFSTSN